jgi:hypothetical protein
MSTENKNESVVLTINLGERKLTVAGLEKAYRDMLSQYGQLVKEYEITGRVARSVDDKKISMENREEMFARISTAVRAGMDRDKKKRDLEKVANWRAVWSAIDVLEMFQ